ncbi:uncharacterized protein LOC110719147 [Chenopodium quinoa]|uniref:uncharacterized protein LOC110719147 n=1 Tax=Chenopodium quinoa TaxID=63459 RepID=UPI000B78E218|nr:uncharacterized protein LOC110719147 [Chenopodium quinoa]
MAKGLPIMDTFSNQGLKVDRICSRCGDANETTLHLFLECAESNIMWRLSLVRLDTTLFSFSNFYDWCVDMIYKCKVAHSWETVMMIIWKIWGMRSSWVFEKKKIDPMADCSKAMAFLDNVGDIIMTASMSISIECSPLEAEAQAVLFGLTLAYDVGLRRLEVESDCLQLVKMLQGIVQEKYASQLIVFDALSLTSILESCSFAFCLRLFNKVAHLIAKSSMTNELRVLMEDCTLDVLPAILGDKDNM